MVFYTHMAFSIPLTSRLKEIEWRYHGRLGIALFNAQSHTLYGFHAHNHFPMCSTFKLVLVGAILKKSEQDKTLLTKRMIYRQQDIVAYSPITRQHIKTGMTVKQLCHAAMLSDDTAANLLLTELGGPNKVNQFVRSIGDDVFHLKHIEPHLSHEDFSTPYAMLVLLRKLTTGNVLSSRKRHQLVQWLIDNNTGNNRIRAAIPKSWIVGDKTGTGADGTTNDIAIIWPPQHKPLFLTIYFKPLKATHKANEKVLRQATQALVDSML